MQTPPELVPLASDERWLEFRTAAGSLLARRAGERGHPAFGDHADAAVRDALARLMPVNGSTAYLAASVAEAGADLGRQVYARRTYEDSFVHAISLLSGWMSRSGFGDLEGRDVFHRTAEVLHVAPPALVAAHEPIVTAFAGGVLQGFLSEAFNCEAHVQRVAARTIRARLGEGRDVNRRRWA